MVAAGAGALLVAAALWRAAGVRIGFVLLAAFLIRTDAGWTRSLHDWDERFHALVAKNLLTDPFKPTLYRNPAVEYDYRDWTSNHVWLHKPPGALWPMAGSMAVFGVNEIAMRLPGVLLSCAAVWLTFLIGRLLFTPGIALLAAGFHAVNGFLVALAAGRRVADHVDTALIAFVELGIWAALRHARNRRVTMLLLSGVALGAGLLTKSLPALLIVLVAFVVFVQQESISRAVAKCVAITIIGVAVAAPWTVYISAMFPREAAAAGLYALMHVSHTLEGHQPRLFAYVAEMPRFFGELVWIPLAAVAVAAVRDRAPELRTLLAWVAIPYVAFSVARTQLPGYVMTAAPAMFLIQAYFWFDLRRRLAAVPPGWRCTAIIALLIVLTVLPARYLLEPTGALERRDRSPAAFRELRTLESRLQLPDAVIFNMPMPIEAMFYSPYTAYRQMPTDDQIRALTAQGRTVVIYERGGTFRVIRTSR
jgi:4-amino-4-deoxy-L-arabinose transferase-like glycosyltransferase